MKESLTSDDLLSPKEVASMLPDTSSQTVLRWIRKGDLRAITLPSGRKYVRRSDVEALLDPDRQENGETDPTLF